jgi:hypothetical protein
MSALNHRQVQACSEIGIYAQILAFIANSDTTPVVGIPLARLPAVDCVGAGTAFGELWPCFTHQPLDATLFTYNTQPGIFPDHC